MTVSPHLTYRPDIQGLRAIAITLVVLAHAGISAFSGGFVGVDVFFVLSGYLITGLLVREFASTGGIQIAGFIARRLKRLLPALLVMLGLVVLIAPALLSNFELGEQDASLVYAVTWTSNLFFAISTLDYFSELQTRDLFLHTWSLGVEEQFYLIWPLLLLLALTVLARQLGRGTHRRQLILVLGTLFAVSLGLSLYWTTTHPLWSFYLMPSRIWQFALGAVVFVWFHRRSEDIEGKLEPGVSQSQGFWSGVAGLALIIGSAVLLHPDMIYPGLWALLPSLGAVLVIASGHQTGNRGTESVLAHPVLVWFGDRSYSLYLWHWPVLIFGFAWGMKNRSIETAGLVALSILLAMLSYRWVEKPFWKGHLSRAAPSRTILLSILTMLVLIAGALNYLSPFQIKDITFNTREDLPAVYKDDCDDWVNSAEVKPCLYGNQDAPNTVVLLGDSIGTQWFSLLPRIFRTPEWRVAVLTKSACPMVDEDYFYKQARGTYTVCTNWRNAVLDYLPSLRPNVVFAGSSSDYRFSGTQWVDGSARILERLTTVADQVIVIAGTPKLSFDGPSCLERRVHSAHESILDSAICRETPVNTRYADVSRYLKQAVQRFPNAMLLDLNDLVCPGGACAALSPDGLVVFRDQSHLTNTFVRKQIPDVIERLEVLGLYPFPDNKRKM